MALILFGSWHVVLSPQVRVRLTPPPGKTQDHEGPLSRCSHRPSVTPGNALRHPCVYGSTPESVAVPTLGMRDLTNRSPGTEFPESQSQRTRGPKKVSEKGPIPQKDVARSLTGLSSAKQHPPPAC